MGKVPGERHCTMLGPIMGVTGRGKIDSYLHTDPTALLKHIHLHTSCMQDLLLNPPKVTEICCHSQDLVCSRARSHLPLRRSSESQPFSFSTDFTLSSLLCSHSLGLVSSLGGSWGLEAVGLAQQSQRLQSQVLSAFTAQELSISS